jgi:hypothetical protein
MAHVLTCERAHPRSRMVGRTPEHDLLRIRHWRDDLCQAVLSVTFKKRDQHLHLHATPTYGERAAHVEVASDGHRLKEWAHMPFACTTEHAVPRRPGSGSDRSFEHASRLNPVIRSHCRLLGMPIDYA